MSWLKKLFGGGGGAAAAQPPVEHNGFAIHVDPIREGGKWRVAARIEKDFGGEVKSHQMIRADTVDAEDVAREVTLNKARQFIDQQGDRIFD